MRGCEITIVIRLMYLTAIAPAENESDVDPRSVGTLTSGTLNVRLVEPTRLPVLGITADALNVSVVWPEISDTPSVLAVALNVSVADPAISPATIASIVPLQLNCSSASPVGAQLVKIGLNERIGVSSKRSRYQRERCIDIGWNARMTAVGSVDPVNVPDAVNVKELLAPNESDAGWNLGSGGTTE